MAYIKGQPFLPQFEDVDGTPLALGTVSFYLWDTTTPTPFYTDESGTPGGTSLTLDILGQPDGVDIFFDSDIEYKLVVADRFETVIDTLGPYAGPVSAYDLGNTTDPELGVSLVGGAERVVDSIEALRDLPKTGGSTRVLVSGYYSAGDGFSRHYWYDSSDTTSADNGGTIIVATDGGRWKLSDYGDVTVRDFGAKGDGVTDDSDAFNAMASATGGVIVMRDEEYLASFSLSGYDKVSIIGGKRPSELPDHTELRGGSIIIGDISITANDVHVEAWGLDRGTGRSVSTLDGLVINAESGEIGTRAVVRQFATLGTSSATTTHGLLVQGFDNNEIESILTIRQQFGVVVKGRNAQINNIDAKECRTAAVYPKSDVPASAADVGDAEVHVIQVTDVRHEALLADTGASAVYLHASTDVFSEAQVSNVYQVNGKAALRIQGGGLVSDPTINSIQATNLLTNAAEQTLYMDGYVYDIQATNVMGINPTSGKVVMMGSNSFGWKIDGVHLVASQALGGSTVMECRGSGAWDNVTVRSTVGTFTVLTPAGSLASISTGKVSGECNITSEGTLTGINSAVAGSDAPTLQILPGSVIKLSGRFDLSASTNKAFCNLPINTGKQLVFACGQINGGAYGSTTVRLNDFQLSMEPSLAAVTVDLSNITIPM